MFYLKGMYNVHIVTVFDTPNKHFNMNNINIKYKNNIL